MKAKLLRVDAKMVADLLGDQKRRIVEAVKAIEPLIQMVSIYEVEFWSAKHVLTAIDKACEVEQ